MTDLPKYVAKILFSEESIDNKIREIANKLNIKYQNSKKVPVFVVIANSGLLFFTKLVSYLTFPHVIDSIKISSKIKKNGNLANIKILKTVNLNLKNHDIYLVNSFFSQGEILKLLYNEIMRFEPDNFELISLIKIETKKNENELDIHYFCFLTKQDINNLIGYGFTYSYLYGSLPYVAIYNKKYKSKYEQQFVLQSIF